MGKGTHDPFLFRGIAVKNPTLNVPGIPTHVVIDYYLYHRKLRDFVALVTNFFGLVMKACLINKSQFTSRVISYYDILRLTP